MAPVVHGLEQQYSDRIGFAYLDIEDDRNEGFKRDLGFRLQPHLFLLDGQGNVLQQWIGMVSMEDLESALQAALP
jgi:hypothetical protein